MLALTLCCCSVLYNFEYITHPDQHSQFWQSWVSDGFVAVHKRFATWDYSWYPNHPPLSPPIAPSRAHTSQSAALVATGPTLRDCGRCMTSQLCTFPWAGLPDCLVHRLYQRSSVTLMSSSMAQPTRTGRRPWVPWLSLVPISLGWASCGVMNWSRPLREQRLYVVGVESCHVCSLPWCCCIRS